MSTIHWLLQGDPPDAFPPVDEALEEPNGLLAAGGDLSVERLLVAYKSSIFPWYEEGQPILWWSPDPRAVLFPDELRISRSLRRLLRREIFNVTFDKAFDQVVTGCAAARPYAAGTWITEAMHQAFVRLHRHGHAHSVEVWDESGLAGGIYGLAIGRVFFGESMFSRANNASKIGLVHLAARLERHEYQLIDCQIASAHLASLGSRLIPRETFCDLLDRHCAAGEPPGPWQPEGEQ